MADAVKLFEHSLWLKILWCLSTFVCCDITPFELYFRNCAGNVSSIVLMFLYVCIYSIFVFTSFKL